MKVKILDELNFAGLMTCVCSCADSKLHSIATSKCTLPTTRELKVTNLDNYSTLVPLNYYFIFSNLSVCCWYARNCSSCNPYDLHSSKDLNSVKINLLIEELNQAMLQVDDRKVRTISFLVSVPLNILFFNRVYATAYQ